MTGTACPLCHGPVREEYKPFCSRRCADLDLRRWLSGRYAIPAAREDEDDNDRGPDVVGGTA